MSNRGGQASRALAARNGEKVLVVDDDARVLDLLQITLSGRGFNVVTAVNGEEALRRIEGARPDVMVIDTHLPRRSGLDVLALVRERSDIRRLPIILISSNASSEAKLEGFRRGADDYVAKPFSPRELILRIRRILDRVEEAEGLEQRVNELESAVSRGERALEETRAGLRSRLFRVGSVIHALQQMGASQNMDDLVSRFVTVCVGYLDLEAAGLFIEDRGNERFVCRVARGLGHQNRRLTLRREGTLADTLLAVDGAVSLATLEPMPEVSAEVSPLRSAGIAYLYPIVVDGTLRGAIGVGQSGGPREAGNSEILAAVANAVGSAIVNQGTIGSLQRTFLETSSLLIESLEARHTGMAGHSKRVAATAVKLAERLDFSESEVEHVRLGALLHDLGLVDLYERLDVDSRNLDDASRARLTEAPAKAAEQIADAGQGPLAEVAAIVRHHHEHWDGSGYPDRLGGESIPKGSRVVALANAFDALTSDRPYRPAFSVDEALEIIAGEAGREFDPAYADALAALAEDGELRAA